MLVYRSVKGANLTPTEVDNNFHDVDDRVTFIEDNPPVARSIDEITAEGSTLIILYTDSTEDVVSLPVIALRGRGDWAPSTNYLVNDAVTASGVVYVVQYAHTSDPTFDPGKNDGNGHDAYGPLFSIPEIELPPGGDDGFVLAKVSGSDFDMEWQARGIPDGGVAGEVLTKLSGDDLDVDWADPTTVPSVVTVTASTLDIDDIAYQNKYVRCTNAGGCDVTILGDDVIDFDVGTEIHFRQCGAGAVVFIATESSDSDASVLLNLPNGFDAATDVEGAVVTIKKVGAGEWDMFGLLAATSV